MQRLICKHMCLVVLMLAAVVPSQALDLRDNAIMHAQRGTLLMEHERYEEAAEQFRASLRLNPYSAMAASAYNNLGVAYRYSGNYSLAMASFQRAIRMQPNYEIYYKNLVETWALAGRLPQAKTAMESLLGYNPANAEAWYFLGLIYEEWRQRETARECFSRYIEREPHSALATAAQKRLK